MMMMMTAMMTRPAAAAVSTTREMLRPAQLMLTVLMLLAVSRREGGVLMLVTAAQSINQLGPCSCEVEGGLVDLSPLANHNNTARFRDLSGAPPYKFSWNPCENFSEGECQEVAGCQLAYHRRKFSLGPQASARFLVSREGLLQIVYHAEPMYGITRTLYVTLVCVSPDEGDQVVVSGERASQRAVYDLTLYSQHACPQAGQSGPALSVGSILLITLALLVFVYLVGGVLFQVCVRKEKGVQVLPHLSYWATVPGLIKDGCLFVKNKGRAENMYQPVS